MTAVMRLQIFPGIQAPTNGNPGKMGIKRGGGATNPDAQAGRRGIEGFNGCHHRSRLAADLQPPIVTVATPDAFPDKLCGGGLLLLFTLERRVSSRPGCG